MQEVFATKIEIRQVRDIKNFDINLSATERKHLIVTGKNGSGKTSLLEALQGFLMLIEDNPFRPQLRKMSVWEPSMGESVISGYFQPIVDLPGVGLSIVFSNIKNFATSLLEGGFVLLYFEAKRKTSFETPHGIRKLEFAPISLINHHLNTHFLQYIVNLQAEKSFANEDGDTATVKRIDEWFANFENRLRDIFQTPNLKLVFDRKAFNFTIAENGKEPSAFNKLPDGYASILGIVSEILVRMENKGAKALDMEGLVLIDEIETHLHIELQKKILPFLTDFFPKIQFIVTTHSPFVISSISNAVVCDLEKKIVTEDLSGYSYEAIVESYFDSDKYSQEVKDKLSCLEALSGKNSLNESEIAELNALWHYFEHLPKFGSPELEVRLQQIKLKTLSQKV